MLQRCAGRFQKCSSFCLHILTSNTLVKDKEQLSLPGIASQSRVIRHRRKYETGSRAEALWPLAEHSMYVGIFTKRPIQITRMALVLIWYSVTVKQVVLHAHQAGSLLCADRAIAALH